MSQRISYNRKMTSRENLPAACFDIDGCLANNHIIMPLIESEYDAGLLAEESKAKIESLYDDLVRGSTEYEHAAHEIVAWHGRGLRGQNENDLYENALAFFSSNIDRYFRYFSKRIFDALRPTDFLIIATAEPEYASRAIRTIFGADAYIGTRYDAEGGIFTGNLSKSLAHRDGKKQMLAGHTIRFAFGDSVGDIGMLESAQYPVSISPSDELYKVARSKGWYVNSGDESDYNELEEYIRGVQNLTA